MGQHRPQIQAAHRFDRRFPAPFLAKPCDSSVLVRFQRRGDAGLTHGFGELRAIRSIVGGKQ